MAENPATNHEGVLPPHQEQPSESSAYVRLQSGDAAGDRCHDFYLKGNRMTWLLNSLKHLHSLKAKQISSVRQKGSIIAKCKLILHKCVHFKENHYKKAHAEKYREI